MSAEKIIATRKNKTIVKKDDTVLKIFDESFKVSDILNEALNQSRAFEAGLSVPKLIEIKKIDGKWAIISEYVEGESLESLMKNNPDKMQEYLELFVNIQMDIHNTTAAHLNKLRDKMSMKIDESGLDATTRYELRTRLEGMPRHKKVCHGDFNPSNIIVKEDMSYYVIDWAHVTSGNASADVARSYLLFMLSGRPEFAEQYMKLFCQKSDTARQYVEKWIPIVAASQLVKGNEDEKDYLMTLVDVAEYQ